MTKSAETKSAELEEVSTLVVAIVRAIVDNPQVVTIRAIEGVQSVVLELSVHPGDVGKVIGKRGIHADAIRRIVHAIGGKHKKRYVLEILEDMGAGIAKAASEETEPA